jgi:sarcosine oxidase gamma subunit
VADGTEVPAIGYMVQMRIAGLKFDQWIKVFGVEMKYPSTRILLGRSFLAGYHVTYSGPDEWFVWHKAGPVLYEEFDG